MPRTSANTVVMSLVGRHVYFLCTHRVPRIAAGAPAVFSWALDVVSTRRLLIPPLSLEGVSPRQTRSVDVYFGIGANVGGLLADRGCMTALRL